MFTKNRSRSNLNLLYFTTSGLYAGVGGGARHESLINIFEQLGINMKLVSYRHEEGFKVKHEKKTDFQDIATIYVSTSSPMFLKALFAIPLFFLYGLKHVKTSDFIFAHSDILIGVPALTLAKLFNKPLIINSMDIKNPDTPLFIYDSVLKNSTIVFAISHYLEEEAKNKGCKNVLYVPLFVDTNVFQRDVLERKKIRKELGISDKEILIGYAGSFWYVEGVPFLLKAFKNLAKKHEHIKLIIIGGRNVQGSDNVPLLIDELLLKEKVILIPQQPHELIPKYLSACDIVCSPKIDCAENRAANPVKVVEYLSMGLPAVCSAVGGIIDTIEDGVDGFLVKPGDVKDLEEKLEGIILNPERSKKIGENGRRSAIEKYSYGAIKDTIKQSIEEIISGKKGNRKI